jgi:hypothetical protein
MDKNKFWLGGRIFNTASPRLGTPTQRKARPQDGRINATQGTSASWPPKRNARHVRKLGAPMHVHNANARHVHNGRHVRTSAVGRHNATEGTSARWSPKRKTHPQRKLIRNTNARHVRTSTSWMPQRNERHVRKMVAQTQNKSTTKTSTQGSTRLKDELEDG